MNSTSSYLWSCRVFFLFNHQLTTWTVFCSLCQGHPSSLGLCWSCWRSWWQPSSQTASAVLHPPRQGRRVCHPGALEWSGHTRHRSGQVDWSCSTTMWCTNAVETVAPSHWCTTLTRYSGWRLIVSAYKPWNCVVNSSELSTASSCRLPQAVGHIMLFAALSCRPFESGLPKCLPGLSQHDRVCQTPTDWMAEYDWLWAKFARFLVAPVSFSSVSGSMASACLSQWMLEHFCTLEMSAASVVRLLF